MNTTGLLSEDFKIGEILAWAHLTYPADWSSFQAMEAEQGPGIQAGFPQVGTLLARLAFNVLWKIKRLRPANELNGGW